MTDDRRALASPICPTELLGKRCDAAEQLLAECRALRNALRPRFERESAGMLDASAPSTPVLQNGFLFNSNQSSIPIVAALHFP